MELLLIKQPVAATNDCPGLKEFYNLTIYVHVPLADSESILAVTSETTIGLIWKVQRHITIALSMVMW